MKNALIAAHAYLENVTSIDTNVTHASINWNYLPASGGSILHPHLHVLASEQPTQYQNNVQQHGQRFFEQYGENYYTALLAEEKRLQERFVGQKERIGWFHAYAPKSHYDFVGVFEETPSCSGVE